MSSSQSPVAICPRTTASPTLHRVGLILAVFSLTCQWCMSRVDAVDWNNPLGGNFTTPSNWQGGVTPGPTDTAYFDLGQLNSAPYGVTLGQDWETGPMAVYNDSISLNLGGKTLRTASSFRQSIYAGIFPGDRGYLHVAHGKLTGVGMQVGAWTNSVGHVEVTGADASISLTESIYGELVVGGGGEGYLTISQQSSVIAGEMGVWVGGHPGTGSHGTGTVELTSGASLQSNGYVHLGSYGGTGHLTVEGGSTLSNSYYGFIGDSADGAGTVSITGEGSLWQTQTIYVGTDGFRAARSGLLAVEDGGMVSAQIWMSSTGTLAGDGGTIMGKTTTNEGRIAPGGSDGAGVGGLTIVGSLDAANASSRLEFGLAGEASFDQLHVNGHVYLGGLIDVDLLDGFTPSAGSSFELLSFSSLSNSGLTFDFSDAPLGGGLLWDTSTFALDGTLRVTAVPEPSAWLLAACGALALPFVRRRRQR